MSGGFEFLKAIGRMIFFGAYSEYKSVKIKVFEQRVDVCKSCEFCKTIASEFDKDFLIKDRCVKGNFNVENFDIYENAKYENNNCPINKW